MSDILEIAYNVITPILLCAGVGLWFGRRFKPDPRVFSQSNLYILLPSLVFINIVHAEIDTTQLGRIALVVAFNVLALTVLGWLVAKSQRNLQPTTQSALMLSVLLINCGNYGLPFVEFAFGSQGLVIATIVFSLMAFFSNTVGIYVASSGAATIRQGIRNVLTTPLPYATVIGFALNFSGTALPQPLERAMSLLGQGSVPVMLLLLGVQLSRISLKEQNVIRVRAILLASVSRLVLAPIILLALTALFGVTGLTRNVIVLQLSMPTAVTATILAGEFGSDVSFISPTILVTTLLSVLTLSVLMVSVV